MAVTPTTVQEAQVSDPAVRHAVRHAGAGAELTLGRHPAAAELRDVGLSTRPIASVVVQQQRFVMPVGRDLGPALARPWFEGGDGEFGRFVTRHADGSVVDHYAPGTADEPLQGERKAEAVIG